MRSGSGARPAILPMTLPGQAIGWSWRAKSTPVGARRDRDRRAERVDDLGDGLAVRDPVAEPGAVDDEPRRRRDHLLHRLERRRVAGEAPAGRPTGPRDDAAAGEEAQERAGVVLGERASTSLLERSSTVAARQAAGSPPRGSGGPAPTTGRRRPRRRDCRRRPRRGAPPGRRARPRGRRRRARAACRGRGGATAWLSACRSSTRSASWARPSRAWRSTAISPCGCMAASASPIARRIGGDVGGGVRAQPPGERRRPRLPRGRHSRG